MTVEAPVCLHVDPLTRQERVAVKALQAGEADAHQQALALAVVVKKLAATHELKYIPGAPDETAFMNGRSFVGYQLLKIINQPVDREVDSNVPAGS